VKPRKRFWRQLRENLLRPKVDHDRLERCLHEVREQLPVPVFWLLGKAQSGKTSLIRALTGSTRGEIGNGFHPCTRTAQLFSFPQDEDCLLKFLDTRGLGEVDYDPSEDIQVLEDQSHLLIVVMKALDHAQQCVLEPLKKILRLHPHWPLIVVQTSLHEAYPLGDVRKPGSGPNGDGKPDCDRTEMEGPRAGCHVLPYPFGDPPYPPLVPADLSRSLAAQRDLFRAYNARFVPVDFTLPEDAYNVEFYGLDELWRAIEDILPLGLRGMLEEQEGARQPLRDIFFRTAHPHILSYSIAAGASAAMPVPFVDVPLVMSIQAKLFHTLASIYHQPMNGRLMAEVAGTLGVGYLARLGGRELLKFIPGFGSVVSGLYAAASTYALGCTLCTYFSRIQDGDVPDPKLLRKLYAEQLEEGRKRLGPYLKNWVRNPGAESGADASTKRVAGH
jgi:uncharacterized protein (DUF697 family)